MRLLLSLPATTALLLLSACATLCSALPSSSPVVVSGQVQVNEHLRDLGLLGADAQANLVRKPSGNAPTLPNATALDLAALPSRYNTLIRFDGKFVFPDVAPGTYQLSIQSRWHAFNTYRVDVNPALEELGASSPVPAHAGTDGEPPSPAAAAAAAAAAARARRRAASQLVKVRVAANSPGGLETALVQPPLPVPLTLSPASRLDFFIEPQPFDLVGMLKSPMVLLAIFGGGMIFLMPKLMANLDPESLKELEQQQASMNAKMAAMQSGDIGSFFKDAVDSGRAQGQSHATSLKKATGSGAGSGAGAKRRR